MKVAGPIAQARGADLLARFKATGRMPSDADKIACIGSIEELDGYRAQHLRSRGPLSSDVFRALTARRREIEGGRP